MEHDARLELPLIGAEVVLLKVLQEDLKGGSTTVRSGARRSADPGLRWYRSLCQSSNRRVQHQRWHANYFANFEAGTGDTDDTHSPIHLATLC
jgi:hypothetical protein